MKIDFKKILRYFSKGRDWQIIIILFAIFLAALILANSYIFWRIGRDAGEPVSAEVGIETLKRDLLNRALTDLQGKESRFNQNLLTKPDISDPSL